MNIPTRHDCDWLASYAASRPIAVAIAAIRFNDHPYPAESWLVGLQAATDENPANAATYSALALRIRDTQGVVR